MSNYIYRPSIPQHLIFLGTRKRIIFLPDKGEEIDAMNIAKYLGWRGKVPKMYWPDGTKDINDMLMKYPETLYRTFGVEK